MRSLTIFLLLVVAFDTCTKRPPSNKTSNHFPDVVEQLAKEVSSIKRQLRNLCKRRFRRDCEQSSTAIATTMNELETSIVGLQSKHRSMSEDTLFSQIYLSSLANDEIILHNLLQSKLPPLEMLKVIDSVREDLQLKLSHLERDPLRKTLSNVSTRDFALRCVASRCSYIAREPTSTSNTDSAGEVTVLVHTKRENVEVSGYEVFYVPKGLADNPQRYSRFPNLSSPTVFQLSW